MTQRRRFTNYVQRAALTILACAAAANGQPRAIDAAKSTMTVRVYKSGMLSALGHDHEISAPVTAGTVDVAGRRVELQVDAGALKVRDPKGSDKDRGEIQANMLGPDVLDAANHKEIRFRSTGAEPAGAGAWKLSGELTLHGATHAVTMDVREHDGHYAGNCKLNITDFGIKPIKAAGGTVKVKDEVQIGFDIQLAH
jgi:polyisoprenoid-binding protein YceI